VSANPARFFFNMPLTKIQNKFPNLDFSKFVYKNAPSKSTVICPVYGEFQQSYLYFYKLKNSVGCPLCLGRVLDFCCTLEALVAENVTFPNGKNVDILFPIQDLAVEFHGLYFHSEKFSGEKGFQKVEVKARNESLAGNSRRAF